MKVCVFGGAGFFGSQIVRCLLSNGHEVATLVRDQQKGAELARLGADVKIGDLRNHEDILIGSILVGQVWVEELTMNHRVRNSKAKEKLGWQPARASCEQGIPQAVAAIER